MAIGRPVTAIGFRRGRGCRGKSADRHPRERDHDITNTPLATNIGAGPARHMCAGRRNWRCMRLCCAV